MSLLKMNRGALALLCAVLTCAGGAWGQDVAPPSDPAIQASVEKLTPVRLEQIQTDVAKEGLNVGGFPIEIVENKVSLETLPVPKENKTKGRIWAVAVGFSVFESDAARLPEYSQNDVERLAEALNESGVPTENVVRMTTAQKEFYLQPTRNNVVSMFERVADRAGADDSIWIVVSGIGAAIDGEAYFLPKGTNLGAADGWISVSEICRIFAESRAKQTTIVWLANRKNVTHLTAPESATKAVPPKNVRVLFSCSPNEFANESNEARLDLFFAEFLAAVERAPERFNADVAALFEEAKKATVEKTRENTSTQTPTLESF